MQKVVDGFQKFCFTSLMSDKKTMSEVEIASRIKAGKTFSVADNKERKKALTCARFMGVMILTKWNGSGYNIFFVKA